MRVAVFFTPPVEHPLTRVAALWLGRDAFSGEVHPATASGGMAADDIAALTAEPRRYGFHATLKPPFRLAGGCRPEDVEAMLDAVAANLPRVDLGRLAITEIGPFFALTQASGVDAIGAFAAEVVRRFDGFRAAPTADEIARRRPERLTERQRANLTTWGYPYVFDDFLFHMTLTGPVAADKRPAVRRILEDRFAALLDVPVVVDALALFVEPARPGDFVVAKRVAMSTTSQPADAT